MINVIKTLKTNAPISDITATNEDLFIIDDGYIVTAYSHENLTSIYKHLLMKDAEDKHIYDKSYAISNAHYAYVANNKEQNGYIYSFSEDKTLEIGCMKMHQNAISFARFSNKSKLLAVGDDDGKAYFYDIGIEKVLFSLPPMADAISNVSFSSDDSIVAISSYDKSTLIYNIETHHDVDEIDTDDVVEQTLFVNKNNHMVGITRDKEFFIYDVKEKEIKDAEFSFKEWPTVMVELGNKHVLVGGRGSILTLINYDTLEIIKEIDVGKVGVKSLLFKKGRLYIGFIDGTLDIVNVVYQYKEFEIHLDLTNFKEATDLIQKNILLLTTKAVKKYDEMWPQVLDMAKELLIKKDYEKSVELVKPFFFDPKKKAEYLLLNSNKQDIETFVRLVKDEKIIQAFKFADANEYLKNTKEYDLIETKWQKIYQTCKTLLMKDDPEATQKAVATLTRYSSIKSKSENITNLIKNSKDYARAQTLVKARNFKLYFILAEKKPYLTLEELYSKVVQLGQQTFTKLLDLENKGNYEKARELGKYLLDFTEFKIKAKEAINTIDLKVNLEEMIKADDIEEIYRTIDEHQELENLKSFIEYHKQYEDQKAEATEAAKDGDTPKVHSCLSSYLAIKNLKPSMAYIFKLSYIEEMKNAAITEFEFIDWSRTLTQYVKCFGADSEILEFAKQYALTHILMTIECDNEAKAEELEFYDTILIH